MKRRQLPTNRHNVTSQKICICMICVCCIGHVKIPRYISCLREILPSQSSSAYSATRRLRVKVRRLQGNRQRISKQHGPATSLASVGCKKRPISPGGINSEEDEEEEEEKKKKNVPTNLVSYQE